MRSAVHHVFMGLRLLLGVAVLAGAGFPGTAPAAAGAASPGSAPGAAPPGTLIPAVAQISPDTGPAAGGTVVTVTGSHMGTAVAVVFGTAVGTDVHVVSNSQLRVDAPAGWGTQHVIIITQGGISIPTASDEYTYGARGPTASALSSGSAGTASRRVRFALPADVPYEHPSPSGSLPGGWCTLEVHDGQPLVPLMCALRVLTIAVSRWSESTRTASVTLGTDLEDTLQIAIGADSARLTTPRGSRTLAVAPPAVLRAPGVTFVPLRLLAQLFGGEEGWDPLDGTASVSVGPGQGAAPVTDIGQLQAEALAAIFPLYPGSAPYRSHVPIYERPGLGEAVQDRMSAASLPLPLSTVESWYHQAGPQGDLVDVTGGTGSDGATGMVFVLPHAQRLLPAIEVTLVPSSAKQTLVRIDALALDFAPPPPGGPVPRGARRVVVTRLYVRGSTGPSTVITDPSQIAALTGVADALPVDEAYQGGVIMCGAEDASTLTGITLAFAYGASAPTIVLEEGVYCPDGTVRVKGTGTKLPLYYYDPTFRLAATAGLSVPH